MENDGNSCDRTDADNACRCDIDFHGAAILDENGNEIPITEDMIRNACQCLKDSWHFPRPSEEEAADEAPASPDQETQAQ